MWAPVPKIPVRPAGGLWRHFRGAEAPGRGSTGLSIHGAAACVIGVVAVIVFVCCWLLCYQVTVRNNCRYLQVDALPVVVVIVVVVVVAVVVIVAVAVVFLLVCFGLWLQLLFSLMLAGAAARRCCRPHCRCCC